MINDIIGTYMIFIMNHLMVSNGLMVGRLLSASNVQNVKTTVESFLSASFQRARISHCLRIRERTLINLIDHP